MFRGDRGNIVAYLGGLILAFTAGAAVTALDYRGDYQERYPGYTDTTEQANPRILPGQVGIGTAQKKTPCADAQGREDSDLCAQWRAANAAKQTARWSLWQLFLGIFGLIGLGLTLWFNKRALDIAMESGIDTEQALGIANRNAEAAANLVKVSQLTANQQLRAYFGFETISATPFWDTAGKLDRIRVFAVWKNYGATPALEVNVFTVVGTGPRAMNPADFKFKEDPASASKRGVVFPGSERKGAVIDLPIELLRKIATNDVVVVIRTRAVYEDIFGFRWEESAGLHVLLQHVPDLLPNDGAKRELLLTNGVGHLSYRRQITHGEPMPA